MNENGHWGTKKNVLSQWLLRAVVFRPNGHYQKSIFWSEYLDANEPPSVNSPKLRMSGLGASGVFRDDSGALYFGTTEKCF